MKPFAHVLYIEHDVDEHIVSVHQTLEQAEDELRVFAKAIFEGDETSDDKIVETLAEFNKHARIYAVVTVVGGQTSAEITPFAHVAKAA
jgi:hypothetical protein